MPGGTALNTKQNVIIDNLLSWRSIVKLVEIIKNNFDEEKRFNLSENDLEEVLPSDFIWRNENDIIS